MLHVCKLGCDGDEMRVGQSIWTRTKYLTTEMTGDEQPPPATKNVPDPVGLSTKYGVM